MSLPHFFLESQILSQETKKVFPLCLSSDDAKHAQVLRLSVGEHLAVVDAENDYFECEIASFDKSGMMVSISRHLETSAPGYSITLVQGLAKGDKLETVFRHATELGVNTFIPFVCRRSVMKLDAKRAGTKLARWQSIVKSAAMQSGQTRIPSVLAPADIQTVCGYLASADAVLICWEEAPGSAHISEALSSFQDRLKASSSIDELLHIAIVVGPEGGLDTAEIDQLLVCNSHAHLITLGSSILRTETAGIVAPALVIYELGGLGR